MNAGQPYLWPSYGGCWNGLRPGEQEQEPFAFFPEHRTGGATALTRFLNEPDTYSTLTREWSFTQFNVPTPKMGTSSSKATVLEVLKVFFDVNAMSAGVNSSLGIFVQTRKPGTLNSLDDVLDPSVIAYYRWTHQFAGSLANGATSQDTATAMVDVTDGDGHGVLVATDQLYLNLKSEATGGTHVGTCKILFRYKTIGVLEYVGIVQSQQ